MRRQHGVIGRYQLLELGFTRKAIEHRIARGRLHPVAKGVYAVGRPRLTQHGRWMAAVLSCGPEAMLSHTDGAALWGIRPCHGPIDVSARTLRRRPGVVVHRRKWFENELIRHEGIPVTNPTCTLVDLATCVGRGELEAAVNEADALDLVTPEELRAALDQMGRRAGLAALRELLDRRTFRLTDSELERLFLRIVRASRLPPPQTGRWVNGFKVDFFWPDLGLVVETDSLRYHRTAAQQTRDRRRDQIHTAAGLIALRFTHAQMKFEPNYVQATLEAVIRIRA